MWNLNITEREFSAMNKHIFKQRNDLLISQVDQSPIQAWYSYYVDLLAR